MSIESGSGWVMWNVLPRAAGVRTACAITAETQSTATKFFRDVGSTPISASSAGPLVDPLTTRVSNVCPSRRAAKRPW